MQTASIPGMGTVNRQQQCQGHAATTFAPPENTAATQPVPSLEVRWILPGELHDAMTEWFSRFRPEGEWRRDSYLLGPGMSKMSVKVRAGRALETKVYGGSPGMLGVPGQPRGRLQCWQKWSFPIRPVMLEHGDGWRTVDKTRYISRLPLHPGRIAANSHDPAGQARCAVELTKVRAHGLAWWSLALEATGPPDLLRGQLEATAAFLFCQGLPAGVELRIDDSWSYAEWLQQRLIASSRPGIRRRLAAAPRRRSRAAPGVVSGRQVPAAGPVPGSGTASCGPGAGGGAAPPAVAEAGVSLAETT